MSSDPTPETTTRESTPIGETEAANREIISTRTIDAPPQRVFNAIRDPKQLAQWWGPKGFTNTFEVFEFRPGGQWRFVMHGPDGTNYQNECTFAEIEEPGRVVIDHVSQPHFLMTISLENQSGKTHITWRMRFDTAEVCAAVRTICTEGNQQNFDRLEAMLRSVA